MISNPGPYGRDFFVCEGGSPGGHESGILLDP